MKLLLCFLGAWMVGLMFSGCGVASPAGYVLGSTGFLQEFNHGRKLEHHTDRDKRELSKLINKNS